MKFRSAFFVSFFALALNMGAQVFLDGYGEIIQTAVANSFPPSMGLTAAVGQIPAGVGNQGTAIVRGRSANGDLLGDGLTASTVSSSNINISAGVVLGEVSTSVVWTTVISWKPVEGADGAIHIQITVTWGNSSESYTREIDALTGFPNGVYPYPTTNPPSTPPSGSGSSGSSAGHYEAIQLFGQYSYFDAAGTMHVVGYFYTTYVWVQDPSGNNYLN